MSQNLTSHFCCLINDHLQFHPANDISMYSRMVGKCFMITSHLPRIDQTSTCSHLSHNDKLNEENAWGLFPNIKPLILLIAAPKTQFCKHGQGLYPRCCSVCPEKYGASFLLLNRRVFDGYLLWNLSGWSLYRHCEKHHVLNFVLFWPAVSLNYNNFHAWAPEKQSVLFLFLALPCPFDTMALVANSFWAKENVFFFIKWTIF